MFRKGFFTTNVNITVAYFFYLWQDIHLLIEIPLTTLAIWYIGKRFIDFQVFSINLLPVYDKALLDQIKTYLWRTKFLLFECFILKEVFLPHQLSTDFASPTRRLVCLGCFCTIFRWSLYETNSFLLKG